MAVLHARYRVDDRDAFLRGFDDFQETRAALGVTGHRVLGAADDPSLVVVMFELASPAAAAAYAADGARREALGRAGVRESQDVVMEELRSLAG
jgi:hypothetical protein